MASDTAITHPEGDGGGSLKRTWDLAFSDEQDATLAVELTNISIESLEHLQAKIAKGDGSTEEMLAKVIDQIRSGDQGKGDKEPLPSTSKHMSQYEQAGGSKDEDVITLDEVDEDKRPFRALLDVGCRATTTGCRIFGALKGAADGGLDVPHSEKRFPGYDRDAKEYDAEMHRERIFGGHVGEYMEYLEEEDNTKYKEQFASYLEAEIEPDGLEDLYEEVHAAIREDPAPAEKKEFTPDKSFKRKAKLTNAERKERVAAKKEAKNAELEEEE